MDFYFLRHGALEGPAPGTFYGVTDFPLSQEGRQQAIHAGERLRGVEFAAAYVSPLLRARQTFALLQKSAGFSSLTPTLDARLQEMNFGAMETLNYTQIQQKQPELAEAIKNNWGDVRFPDGESVDEFRSRVDEFVWDIAARFADGQKVLVVCHGGVIRTSLCQLLQLPNPAFAHLHSEFACWATVRVSEGWGVLRELNA